MLQTSGFYKALLTTSDKGEVNTRDNHKFPWPVLDRGLCFHNHPLSIPTKMSLYFFFNHHCIFDVF